MVITSAHLPVRRSTTSASIARAAALLVVAAVVSPAYAEPGVNAADRHFMDEAAASGMVEIVLGRVAQEKATTDGVRHFGAQMVEDHNKANEDLKQMAAAKSVPLPTGLTAEQKAMVGQMKKRKGAGFDQAYIARMIDDHRRAVALFERADSSAADADVKSFAARNLPILRSHLAMAQQAAAVPAAAAGKAAARLAVKPVTRE